MWHARWDPHDIPRSDLAAHSTHNRSIPFFMRADGFSIHQFAANYKDCRSGLHEEDVGLGFVPFGRAICGTVHQENGIVGIIG